LQADNAQPCAQQAPFGIEAIQKGRIACPVAFIRQFEGPGQGVTVARRLLGLKALHGRHGVFDLREGGQRGFLIGESGLVSARRSIVPLGTERAALEDRGQDRAAQRKQADRIGDQRGIARPLSRPE
jgi:hypothetical protein